MPPFALPAVVENQLQLRANILRYGARAGTSDGCHLKHGNDEAQPIDGLAPGANLLRSKAWM